MVLILCVITILPTTVCLNENALLQNSHDSYEIKKETYEIQRTNSSLQVDLLIVFVKIH